MAGTRKKPDMAKNGRPTPSSSRIGTRSQTPASKASPHDTPVTETKTPSTTSQKPTTDTKRTENQRALTESNLKQLSNGDEHHATEAIDEPPSSPLSSAPSSMKGPLEEYFRQISAQISNQGAASGPSNESGDGIAEGDPSSNHDDPEEAPDTLEDVVSAPQSASRVSCQKVSAVAVEVEDAAAVPKIIRNSQGSTTTISAETFEVQPAVSALSKDTAGKSETPARHSNNSQDPTEPAPGIALKENASTKVLDGYQHGDQGPLIASPTRLRISGPSLKEIDLSPKDDDSSSPRSRKRNYSIDEEVVESVKASAQASPSMGSFVEKNGNVVDETVRRSKRAKTQKATIIEFDPDDMELPYDKVTKAQIEDWEGWLEMESSPETLTVMLQEWGVYGMKAIDVYSLDPEALILLPQPVHGLIFCYPYQDGDWGEQMDPCPEHVWFANQVDGTNACGTVATMNIINNIPDANLGPSLGWFKSHTKNMTAVERGRFLNEFQPIKAVHNSFICINDMMDDDVVAEKDHEKQAKLAAVEAQKKAKAKLAAKKKKAAEKAAQRQERAAAKAAAQDAAEAGSDEEKKSSASDKTGAGVTKSGVAKKKKTPVRKTDTANKNKKNTTTKPKKETPAQAKAAAKKKADALARARHHYVAYLPINGEIWKIDGMDDEPLNLGPCDHATWLESVAPFIQASMIDLNQENIDFSLLALVQDPLYNDAAALAANIKTMHNVDEQLAEVDPDWIMHEDAADCLGDESLDGPSEDYKVSQEMIDEAELTSSNQDQLQQATSVDLLLKMKKSLMSQQKMLKSSIRSGKAEEDERQAQVDQRRRDFGPLVQWQMMDLFDDGCLDELLDLHDPKKQNGTGGGAGGVKSKNVNGKANARRKKK